MQKLLDSEFFVWLFNINLDEIEISIQIFSTHKKNFSPKSYFSLISISGKNLSHIYKKLSIENGNKCSLNSFLNTGKSFKAS
jgi:hypothetical protein